MHTVTKKELVDRIAEKSSTKHVLVKKIVQGFLDEIVAELGRGNRLEFRDFGVFESRHRAPRIGEHNAEIYKELGLSVDELKALKKQKVI